MHIISQKKVSRTIQQFIYKEVENRDGVLFKTVPVEEEIFMEQFLNRFYYSFETLFKDKHKAAEIFTTRLMKIDGVRFDDKDQDLMPFKLAFDDMKMTDNGKPEVGLFMASTSNGRVLLDMDFMNLSRKEAAHTLIHELIHAMSTVDIKYGRKIIQKCGVNMNGKTFMLLNEGITEYIAQLMWRKMYPTKQCPGIGRYSAEVKGAELVMSRFDSIEDFIEDYITNGTLIESQMQEMKNENGKTLFDYIKSFDNKNIYDLKIQRKVLSEINDFKFENLNSKNY